MTTTVRQLKFTNFEAKAKRGESKVRPFTRHRGKGLLKPYFDGIIQDPRFKRSREVLSEAIQKRIAIDKSIKENLLF